MTATETSGCRVSLPNRVLKKPVFARKNCSTKIVKTGVIYGKKLRPRTSSVRGRLRFRSGALKSARPTRILTCEMGSGDLVVLTPGVGIGDRAGGVGVRSGGGRRMGAIGLHWYSSVPHCGGGVEWVLPTTFSRQKVRVSPQPNPFSCRFETGKISPQTCSHKRQSVKNRTNISLIHRKKNASF